MYLVDTFKFLFSLIHSWLLSVSTEVIEISTLLLICKNIDRILTIADKPPKRLMNTVYGLLEY